jgi:hypothetical protein
MGDIRSSLETNFGELRKGEVRRIPLLGTRVHKGKGKGRMPLRPGPQRVGEI